MSVIDVTTDLETRTLTVTAEFPATVERLWRLWSDPRQLERWWGPPGYPATVTEHDLRPDGLVRYHMTGPDGEEYHGLWQVAKVDAPHLLVLEDRFAEPDGSVAEELPGSSMELRIESSDAGASMRMVSRYETVEALEQVLEMGTVEGIRGALGQVDGLLAEDA
jgi:uncharacterized protein YndB with AHSA1/START domain